MSAAGGEVEVGVPNSMVGMLQPEVHFVQVKTVSDIVPALQRPERAQLITW